MRIYSYIRVSSRGQIDGDGPERQREVVKKFCAQHSLSWCGEFFERGVSGDIDSMDRPQFREMLECIQHRRDNKTDEVEAIVVERLDRLARTLMVSELLLAKCRKEGIKVFAGDQGNLTDLAADGSEDPTRILIRQILGALAQWDKSCLVLKLRGARERKKIREGWIPGRRPFRECPGGELILDFILQKRSEGLSFEQIAEFLNDEGLPRRKGGPWTRNNVFDVVKAHNNRKKLVS